MKRIVAHKGERLDEIVYKHYKDLRVLPAVLEANPHLTNQPVFDTDTHVMLPTINMTKEIKKEVKTLW